MFETKKTKKWIKNNFKIFKVFSTRAESNYYRSFGFDVIGMTSLPEAKLAREGLNKKKKKKSMI